MIATCIYLPCFFYVYIWLKFAFQSGLQQRLSEQENSFLVMKAELLRAGFCQQSLENTKVCTDKEPGNIVGIQYLSCSSQLCKVILIIIFHFQADLEQKLSEKDKLVLDQRVIQTNP